MANETSKPSEARKQFWRDVYLKTIKDLGYSHVDAGEAADAALIEYDKRFGEVGLPVRGLLEQTLRELEPDWSVSFTYSEKGLSVETLHPAGVIEKSVSRHESLAQTVSDMFGEIPLGSRA